MGDIFEGVDLDDLANSETPIVGKEDLTVPTVDESGETTTGKEGAEAPKIDPNAVDLDALASLETIDVIENKEGNEEEEEEAPEGDKIQKPSQTPADKTTGTSPSSQDTFTSLASALTEAGVFSSLSEEEVEKVTSVETLLEAVAKQTQEARYADLNEKQKNYLEALENGVPHAEYAEHTANADQYKNLADDKINAAPALQKELIKRSFIVKGITNEEADKYATLSVNAGTGAEDALRAKASLVAYEEAQIEAKVTTAKTARDAKIEADKIAIAALKSKVQETKEIIPGIKMNSTTRNKIFASMTNAVDLQGDDPQNEVMKAYEESEDYKLALHTVHTLTKGFTDFSKFTKISKSTAVKALEDTLNSKGSGASGKTGTGLQTPIGQGLTSKLIGEQLNKKKF